MLIVQMVLKFMLTHKYSKDNEVLLNTAYFDIWGKNDKCKTLVEWWKGGLFDRLELIDCDWIYEYIGNIEREYGNFDHDGELTTDEGMAIEQMVEHWRRCKR